ncbi:MAG TPA: NAD(P)/FAD-dependent oxidoreductase, partial [bacterium (Candidatus Stahlbacteria)]|nr:NAD(P)/FAD-dependent oxidoreductase [Candidatus Stahlbacteria bacterium]
MDFEIVVCGAGPAGSTAAYKAAEQDHSVLLVDRKPRPGVPIFCAEGISRSMVKDYLEIKPEWISARVNGALIISDNYQTFVNYPDVGYILDRERFDYGLFQKAIRAGAQFMAGEITDISDDHLILN